MLGGLGEEVICNEKFRLGLIDFYTNMNGFVYDKMTVCNCIAYLDVLKDTFLLMSRLCKLKSSQAQISIINWGLSRTTSLYLGSRNTPT